MKLLAVCQCLKVDDAAGVQPGDARWTALRSRWDHPSVKARLIRTGVRSTLLKAYVISQLVTATKGGPSVGRPALLGNWRRLVGLIGALKYSSHRQDELSPLITNPPTTGRRPIEQHTRLLAIPDLARMAPLPTAVRSSAQMARKALQQRSISDVAITRTGKPILRVQGGRSVWPAASMDVSTS